MTEIAKRPLSIDFNCSPRAYEIRNKFPLENIIKRSLSYCNEAFGFRWIGVKVELSGAPRNGSLPIIGRADKWVIGISFFEESLDDFQHNLKYLPAAIGHEFEHLARRRLRKPQANTLLNKIIDEGAAIWFQRRLYPSLRYPFRTITPELLSEFSKEALVEQDMRFDESMERKWIDAGEGFPKGAIYHVAELWMGEYVNRANPDLRGLVKTTANDFVKYVSVREFTSSLP